LTHCLLAFAIIVALWLSLTVEPAAGSTIYKAEYGGIASRNGDRFYNRPLYCNHIQAHVTVGDRPTVRLSGVAYVYGYFLAAYARGDKAVWLHEFSDLTSVYKAGLMEWRLRDDAFGPTETLLQVVPTASGAGFAARLSVAKACLGDRIIWFYGGAGRPAEVQPGHPNVAWYLDPIYTPAVTKWAFRPEDCVGGVCSTQDDSFGIVCPKLPNVPQITVTGSCGAPSDMRVVDARSWAEPLKLCETTPKDAPAVAGIADVRSDAPVFWTVSASEEALSAAPDAAASFGAGLKRVQSVATQVVSSSPDPMLDAQVAAACHAMNGTYLPPVYVHGAMAWNLPFLGWRSVYGVTAFGWYDNVKAQGLHYFGKQEKGDRRNTALSDPNTDHTLQSPDSIYWGKGRIPTDNNPYNMQTQFFDQMVDLWRHTGDVEFEKSLRPALDLHLEWSRRCFDPDGDGCYESFINTWPTDTVWYNGGGSVEESAYVYRARLAAAEMAERAGDTKAAASHRAEAEKIRLAVMRSLWDTDRGHCGVYREQGGLERLHTDAWLYSITLPIDVAMITRDQMLTSLYYTEWGLEKVKPASGGEKRYTSNWVPSIWSVRELYPGDNYDLALAYYRAGMPDAAWEIIRGNFVDWGYNATVPGGLSHGGCGADFTDIASMFCRMITEGLYGYRPDYPNGRVLCAPGMPSGWNHGSIKSPAFSLEFRASQGSSTYKLSLATPAAVEFRLPVRAKSIRSVTLNGRPVTYEMEAEPGRSVVIVKTNRAKSARVGITWSGGVDMPLEESIEARCGESIRLAADGAEIVSVSDTQQALVSSMIKDGEVIAKLSKRAGSYLVIARVRVGDLEALKLFKLKLTDPAADARQARATVKRIPRNAKWRCVDLGTARNGDIRSIFSQKYLTPRPNTVSARIATDGYTAWNLRIHGIKPPPLGLEYVSGMLDSQGRMVTPRGVPFIPPDGKANAAITSLWDNWPRSVRVPVSAKGDAVWLLVCGSTNPMQCRIANAEIRLNYADGVVDRIELIPPLNYWAVCHYAGADYNYDRDRFCLPAVPPETLALGSNCRAVVLSRRLRPGVELTSVEMEALSQEVVIGLMGVTIMD